MDEPIKHGEDQHGFLAGLVIGALAGGAAALLLSPKNGKEMRTALRQFADEWKDEAAELSEDVKDILGQFQEALEEGVSEVRELAEKPVARVAKQAEEVRDDAPEKVGQKYHEVRQSVQDMIDSWRAQQPDQDRFAQRDEVREVAPRREVEKPEPEDWPTYPTGNGDYYHNFKGGSVSAVAEPEVRNQEASIKNQATTTSEEGGIEDGERPVFTRANAPAEAKSEMRTFEEPKDEQPFLAPRPQNVPNFFADVQPAEPVAQKEAARLEEEEDIPSFKRASRTISSRTKPLSVSDSVPHDDLSDKPVRKTFFKRK